MRRPIRAATVLLALAAGPAAAQPTGTPGGNPIPAIRADRWADAQAEVANLADPVARKLVTYYRLIAPGAATPAEIATFMRDSPDWPNQALLERRRQDAIAVDPDDADVLAQCNAPPVTQAPALLRCAAALANAGRHDEAAADARRAWVTSLTEPAQEADFQKRWNGLATPDDQWARFQQLAWHDLAAATRQVARLDAARRPVAEARLALERDEPRAEALFTAVPATDRTDPGLFLARARYLRHAGRETDAVALWQSRGTDVEQAARGTAPDHLGAFWAERNFLARDVLAAGDSAAAYSIAAGHRQVDAERAADAEFLAGFIALRKLHQPAEARPHFVTLAGLSHAAITQGRAWYWLGRTDAETGTDPHSDYEKAAAWPTTFYGQLGALALGDDQAALTRRIKAVRDPGWTRDTVLSFTGHEVVRAAAWLVAWNDPHRARAFLLRMDELAPNPAERALSAALAMRVGLPETAVFVARRMGRDGLMLPQLGWPMPYEPAAVPVDPAAALGVMRQESNFDIGALSSSGARGLMQLMPATAADVARQLGVASSPVALTTDPAHNILLGTTYIKAMLEHFGGSLPLAVAAYNAGPHRVDQWLQTNGDPRTGTPDMIDWLEQIPFSETRNYVQRVLENVTIYQARRGEKPPTVLVQWMR